MFGGGSAESPTGEAKVFVLSRLDYTDQGFLPSAFPIPDERHVGEDEDNTCAVRDTDICPRESPGP